MSIVNLGQLVAEAAARGQELADKVAAWKAKLPNELRLGDIVSMQMGRDAVDFHWFIVKPHRLSNGLYWCVITDNRYNMVGRSDIVVDGEVHKHVIRPTVGQWIHESDIRLSDRYDHIDSIDLRDHCVMYAGKISPEVLAVCEDEELDDSDQDYIEWLETLAAWRNVVTECLHSGFDPQVVKEETERFWAAQG